VRRIAASTRSKTRREKEERELGREGEHLERKKTWGEEKEEEKE